jgi:hypothetical protein
MAIRSWSNFTVDEFGSFTTTEWDGFLLDPTSGVYDGYEGYVYGTGYIEGDFYTSKLLSGNIAGTGYFSSDISLDKNFGGVCSGEVFFESFMEINRQFEGNISGYLNILGNFKLSDSGSLALTTYCVMEQYDYISLYINSNPLIADNQIPLFLCNYNSYNNLDLIIKGDGDIQGSIPFDDYITLFIGNNHLINNSFSLFIKSYIESTTGNLDMFIKSANVVSSGLDLLIGSSSDEINYNLSLFCYGY